MRGKFISLEGGEGAGKSTQAKLLKAKLEAAGHRVVLTREPGGSPGAEDIRKLLVQGEPDRWTPLTETLLFLAARSDHVARVIAPALARGDWVITDRFSDSTIVYQGVARGLGIDRVRSLQAAVQANDASGVLPDLTLVLDLPAEAGLERTRARKDADDRFEKFDGNFHEKLRAAFREIARAEPKRCATVDAARDQASVANEIWTHVVERLNP